MYNAYRRPKQAYDRILSGENKVIGDELDYIQELVWLVSERDYGADYAAELIERLRVRERLNNIFDLLHTQGPRLLGRPPAQFGIYPLYTEQSRVNYRRAEYLRDIFFPRVRS